MTERFVSEPLKPLQPDWEAAAMATGAPGLPQAFRWRQRTLRIDRVLQTWRETGPCRHGSLERYVRKHWFEVTTTDGLVLKLYFQRQPQRTRRGNRWWLFTVRD